MDNHPLSAKIEAWLQGKLPAAEAAAFQAEMAADPALAEEVDLHRLTLQAMDHLSEQHLQQNVLAWMEGVDIADIGAETTKPQLPKTSGPNRNWLLVAVALLFLAGAFMFYQKWKSGSVKQRIAALEAEVRQRDSLLSELKQRPLVDPAQIDSLSLENEQLRQQLKESTKVTGKPSGPFAYYSKPKDLGDALRRGEESPVNKLLKDGVRSFQKSDLKQAEDKARAALKIDSTNRVTLRLLAHTLFGQHRFLEAEPVFARLQKGYAASSTGAKEAAWNRLLCYRALSADAGQQALYDAALNAILKETDHPYHTQAVQMEVEVRRNEK